MGMRLLAAAALVAGAALFSSPFALAAEVTVFSTVAAKSAMEQMAPGFERATGHRVILKFATAAELKSEIEKGAHADVAILTAAAVDDLIRQGKLTQASRAGVARSGVGIATRKDDTRTFATSDELKQALVSAKSVVLSAQGATGPIMRRAFEKFGIAEAMAGKIVLVTSVTAAAAVANGQGELGFTQVSEVLDTPASRLAGPLPADIQVFSAFVAAGAAAPRDASATQAFLGALQSQPTKDILKSRGLDPD